MSLFTAFLFQLLEKVMSDLLTKLIDLFQLDKINFTTANRKTIDEFLSKTEFQKRRQTLFEAS